MRLEALERREVFDVALQSVFSLGPDEGSTRVAAVVSDASGNRYLTGNFTGTVDFDPSATRTDNSDVLVALGSSDVFVAKYDAADHLVWARRAGGTAESVALTDGGTEILLDTAGNVVVAGRFQGTGDFGALTLSSAGETDLFVTKLDATGKFLWAQRSGGSLHDSAMAVDIDSSGNIYTANSRFFYGVDVQKWSPAGNLLWSRSVEDKALIEGDMRVDSYGNVFLASSFQGTVDFDPSSRTYSLSSISYPSSYVLKLTTAGNFSWVKTFTGNTSGSSAAARLDIDSSGNLIVGGFYSGTVDFDPSTKVQRLQGGGAYIAQLNNKGALNWVKGLEKTGSMTVMIWDIDWDATGGIYVLGSYTGTGSVDFDPGTGVVSRTSAGGHDSFLLNLSSSGSFKSVDIIGGAGDQVASGLYVAADGTINIVGSYQGAVDFDLDPLVEKTLTNSGTGRSGFVARYRKA